MTKGNVFTGLCRGVPNLHSIIFPLVPYHFWGGGGNPSPSHNTTTGSMSLSVVPHLHPIILPLVPCPFQMGRTPQSQVGNIPVPGRVVHQSQVEVPPSQDRTGYPLPRTGLGYPPPQPDRMGTLPLSRTELGYPPSGKTGSLDRLRCGQYASCSFPQEDCLVTMYTFKTLVILC